MNGGRAAGSSPDQIQSFGECDLFPTAQPKRPKTKSKVLSDDQTKAIACHAGKHGGWFTRVKWNATASTWEALTDKQQVMFGDDMICYLDKAPTSPAELLRLTKVFARFCVAKVFIEN
jgi:hypothetical protein